MIQIDNMFKHQTLQSSLKSNELITTDIVDNLIIKARWNLEIHTEIVSFQNIYSYGGL